MANCPAPPLLLLHSNGGRVMLEARRRGRYVGDSGGRERHTELMSPRVNPILLKTKLSQKVFSIRKGKSGVCVGSK